MNRLRASGRPPGAVGTCLLQGQRRFGADHAQAEHSGRLVRRREQLDEALGHTLHFCSRIGFQIQPVDNTGDVTVLNVLLRGSHGGNFGGRENVARHHTHVQRFGEIAQRVEHRRATLVRGHRGARGKPRAHAGPARPDDRRPADGAGLGQIVPTTEPYRGSGGVEAGALAGGAFDEFGVFHALDGAVGIEWRRVPGIEFAQHLRFGRAQQMRFTVGSGQRVGGVADAAGKALDIEVKRQRAGAAAAAREAVIDLAERLKQPLALDLVHADAAIADDAAQAVAADLGGDTGCQANLATLCKFDGVRQQIGQHLT